MKIETAQAFTLLTGRNVCGLTAHDLCEKTGIPLERMQLLEQGNARITLDEIDAVAKMLFYRRHMFLGIRTLYERSQIGGSDILASILKQISDLPVDSADEIIEIFKRHEKDGFNDMRILIIHMRFEMLKMFYDGAIRNRNSPDDDENWRDNPPDEPIKPISPSGELLLHPNTVVTA
jgi:hypothetical protein